MGFPGFFTCSALQDEKGVNALENEEEEVEGASFMEGCGFLGFSYCGVAVVIHLGKDQGKHLYFGKGFSHGFPNGQGLVGLFRGGHEAKCLGSKCSQLSSCFSPSMQLLSSTVHH